MQSSMRRSMRSLTAKDAFESCHVHRCDCVPIINEAEVKALQNAQISALSRSQRHQKFLQNFCKYQDNVRKFRSKEKEKGLKTKEKNSERNSKIYGNLQKLEENARRGRSRSTKKRKIIIAENEPFEEEKKDDSDHVEVNNEEPEEMIIAEAPKEEAKEVEKTVVDLSDAIEAQLNMSNAKTYNTKYTPNTVLNTLQNIDKFRKTGDVQLPQSPKKENAKKANSKKITKNTNLINSANFTPKAEKRKYILALKKIMTERFGEKNIVIQNICSCGNLQRKLNAILESGNISIYALTECDCANNCIYYNKPGEYKKCVYDLLKCVQNISYENFKNKY